MASELFENIFHSGTSGCVRTCACGRTYFDGEDTTIDWEDGELEQLQEKSERAPEWFIETDYSVPTVDINDKEYVFGCQCGLVDKYENFIENYASRIAEYLNKKAEELKRTAENITVKG